VELIIHAGGVLADATLQQQHLRGVQSVVGTKLSPVSTLLRACEQHPVRSVVLFSSVASLLGSPGQSNYAAANAGLDAAARAGQVCGLPAVSVQWGAWSGGGMAASDAQTAARVERMGMSLISPAAGLAALEGAMRFYTGSSGTMPAAPVIAAVPFNWPQFLQHQEQRVGDITFFKEFSTAAEHGTGIADTASDQAATSGLSAAAVKDVVISAVTEVLGASVTEDEPLMAAGLDSLGSVELRNTLESRLNLKLPPTLVSHGATINAKYISFVC
jgi:acyl carrier protein